MKQYKVWLRSIPGMYEQYDGYVKVWAEWEEQAKEKALDKLKRESFPDRTRDMWKIEKVEQM